jgi:large subunit ribosomal protein L11
MDKEVLKIFSIFLRSNKVESGPPLSTILGNFGINTVKFVKDFNDYTKDLPDYFLLVISVTIFNDKTYIFSLNEPSISFLLRVISLEKDFLIKGSGGYIAQKYKVIKINDVVLISVFKYGFFNINTLKLILGTIQSMDLHVVEEL